MSCMPTEVNILSRCMLCGMATAIETPLRVSWPEHTEEMCRGGTIVRVAMLEAEVARGYRLAGDAIASGVVADKERDEAIRERDAALRKVDFLKRMLLGETNANRATSRNQIEAIDRLTSELHLLASGQVSATLELEQINSIRAGFGLAPTGEPSEKASVS